MATISTPQLVPHIHTHKNVNHAREPPSVATVSLEEPGIKPATGLGKDTVLVEDELHQLL